MSLTPTDGSQMDDDIRHVNELRNQLTILDVVEVIFHAFGRFQMTMLSAAGGKIVEQHNAIAAIEQSFRKMRTDESQRRQKSDTAMGLLTVPLNRRRDRGKRAG